MRAARAAAPRPQRQRARETDHHHRAGEHEPAADGLRRILPLIDLAHGNVRELCAFTDTSDLNTALQSLARWGAGAVVVHKGAEGAGYYAEGQLVTEPPAPVKQRLIATGTGDALSVCMALLHDRADIPVQEKLRLSNAIVAEFMEGKRRLIPGLD